MIDSIIGKEFPNKVIPLINEAKKAIDIVVFDWRWYPNDPANPVQLFNQSIISARKRGVAVRVITNIDEIVRILIEQGIKAKKLITGNIVHIKMMLIDGETLIIGSHNYTQSAFTMNFEVSVILSDEATIKRLTDYFNNLFR